MADTRRTLAALQALYADNNSGQISAQDLRDGIVSVYPDAFNVKNYGATGDGTTDDTTAVQAAIDACASAGGGLVYFPVGTYLISSALTITNGDHGVRLVGAGREASVIQQDTDNTPIVQISGALVRSSPPEYLKLIYTNQQTPSETSAIALLFTNAGNASPGYFSDYHDLWIEKAYRAIAISGSGQVSVWGSSFRNIEIRDCDGGIYLTPPSAVGQPNIYLEQVTCEAPNITTTGFALRCSGGAQVQVNCLTIEDWDSRLIYISGGNVAFIYNLHVERPTITEDSAHLIEVANGPLIIANFTLTSTTINNSGTAVNLFRVTTGASLHVQGFYGSSITLTSGSLNFISASGSNGVWLDDIDEITNLTKVGGSDTTSRREIQRWTGPNEVVTAASPTLNNYAVSLLDSSSNGITATLGSGLYIGQLKTIVMVDASNSSTVSVSNHETSDPEVFTFAQVDDTLVLMWTGTEWITVANSGVTT